MMTLLITRPLTTSHLAEVPFYSGFSTERHNGFKVYLSLRQIPLDVHIWIKAIYLKKEKKVIIIY